MKPERGTTSKIQAIMAKTLLLLLLSLIIFPFSLSSFTLPFAEFQTFKNAMEILSTSGYLSMALTLKLISQSRTLNFPTATIFAPLDIAFFRSGQPSLLLLKYHISPLRISVQELKALQHGAKIPTLQSQLHLVVTSSNSNCGLLINDVKINETPIFDDGSLIIYGIGDFFNSSFVSSQNLAPAPNPNLRNRSFDSFDMASDILRSKGYSKMATFLDLQLAGVSDETKMTIFAPIDELIDLYVKNFSDYSSVFRRHVVPNLLARKDLVGLDDGTMLSTFAPGFTISVAKSGDVLLLNEVPLIFPDMYNSNWIVVHGLNQLLVPSLMHDSVGDSFSELDEYKEDERNAIMPDYGEY